MTEIFAELMKQVYLERLKYEMESCLEEAADNIDLVLKDLEEGIYKAEEHIIIEGDVDRFFQLRVEYDQVLTTDSVEWWTAMVQTSLVWGDITPEPDEEEPQITEYDKEAFYAMLRLVGDDFFVDGGMNLGSEEIKKMILEAVFKEGER